MPKYFTYIAECADGSLYTGYCRNIEEREKAHNEGNGTKYTSGRKPVKIVYIEEYDSKGEAMSREIQIKKYTREKKMNLIRYNHPTKFK
jgi:putative endonuclease